jgi:putative endonuclease
MRKQPAVYMLCSQKNGTLYVGVTGMLVRRVWQHKTDMVEGFSGRYGVHRLVWFELHDTMDAAITREKQIKNWQRRWKLELIERNNPDWVDLYNSIV